MRSSWLWLACALLSVNGPLWAMTADDLVRQTGVSGGLCSFPRAAQGDEKLALELAKRPTFVVHLLSPGDKGAAAIRGAAEAEGVLGRSLYVEKGPAAPLPFADRLVDLLVISDLSDADLTPELRSAWLRALAPRRGAALVGRAKDAGGGLSQDALKAWTKDLPLAKVLADQSGVWALLRTDLPAGADPWTHRCHGPDNAQVSSDATLKPPFLAQWWGMPRQEGFWGTTVVAGNGRMFSMRSSRNSGEQVVLTARSLTSGVVLWQRLLRQAPEGKKAPHGGYVPGRCSMVALGDTLLLVDRDGVLRLSAETGAETGRTAGPKPGGQVKWIASAGGLLAVLAGDADAVTPITYQTVAANPVGRELAVYDAAAGRQLWRESLAGDVDERLIALRDDRLYCLVQGTGMVCRELRTGKNVWTNTDSELQADFRTPESKSIGELLFSQPALMALDEVLLLRVRWGKNITAVSRADGSLLWKKPTSKGGRALTSLAWGGLWIGGGSTVDLKTGKPAQGPKFVSSGCGPTTAMPGYLITCFGAVSDMQSGLMVRHEDIKSPCDVGTLVAEGLMVTVPSECQCNFEVKGYRALTSAGAIRPHTAPAWAERLTVLDPADPAPLSVTDADWPTYRRDPQRSAASAAAVGEQPKILWQWKPSGAAAYSGAPPAGPGPRLTPDFLPTAPVAAAGRVWFASHDGAVRCVTAADGKEVWKFPTGAMVFAPPTIDGGRALVGGGDGRIYCLDAATGRCLWQFRAAPAERRVFWFGHLVSTWPVLPGVVVHEGVAYTVAGYHKENGIHAYALDPNSGKVLWEKDDAGTGGKDGPKGAYSSNGQVAVGGGRLWLCSSTASPGAFELSCGEWSPLGKGLYGSEIGVLGGQWVVQGGRRLSETQDTLTRALGSSGFAASAMDGPPTVVGLGQTGTSLPAWDAQLCVMPSATAAGPLTAVPTAKALQWLADEAARKAEAKGPVKVPKSKGADWSDLKLWATENMVPVAYALAKDQVVVAYKPAANSPGYKLSAFRRTDGAVAWTVDLPEQPAMNRLALDRDGRVLVALCDGSILCVGR